MHEGAEGCRIHRVLDIGIVEHDERVLAAELDAALLEQAAGLCGDLAADGGRAGEADAVHGRVRDQLVADLGDVVARAGDDVEHAGRHAGLLEDFGEQQPAGDRRLL